MPATKPSANAVRALSVSLIVGGALRHPDFDPRRDHALTSADGELTEVERIARTATTQDDVQLEAVSRG